MPGLGMRATPGSAFTRGTGSGLGGRSGPEDAHADGARQPQHLQLAAAAAQEELRAEPIAGRNCSAAAEFGADPRSETRAGGGGAKQSAVQSQGLPAEIGPGHWGGALRAGSGVNYID